MQKNGNSGAQRLRGGGLTLLLLTFLCTCARAQKSTPDTVIYEIPYRKLTVREGLTRNQLMHVWEDRDGFVWLVGKRGVDRFDGLEVLSYQSDTNAIQEHVLDVGEDANGTLWFFGERAEYRYAGGRMERTERDSIATNRHRYQRINGKTLCYIAERDYPYKTTSVWLDGRKVSSNLYGVKLDSYGAAVFLARHDTGDGPDTLYRQEAFPDGPITTLRIAQNIDLTGDKHLKERGWIIISDSLFSITGHGLEFDRHFYHDNNKQARVSSGNSILLRDYRSILAPEAPRPVLYRGKHLLNQAQQRNERLFVSSEQGLVSLRPRDALTIYPVDQGMVQNVWSMVGAAAGAGERTKEAMFFFPFTGDHILKLADGRYEQIPLWNGEDFNLHGERHVYPGALRRANGHILFASNRRAVNFDPVTNTLRPLGTERLSSINDLLETGDTIFAATRGLRVYVNDQHELTYGQPDGLDVNTYEYFETLIRDRDGRIWLGSHRGLAVREPDGSFRNYYEGEAIPGGIVDSKVDYRGNLWFATHKGVAFHDYTDSLPRWIDPGFTEDIKFVQPVGADYVILGGTKQLFILDLQAFYAGEVSLYPFDEDDGFPVAECLQAAVHLADDGAVWIGTTESVIKLEPERLVFHREPTQPHFQSFGYQTGDGREDVLHRIPFNENGRQHFTISSTDEKIDFRFFTINHDKPHAITYQHRLVGLRETWSRPETTRYAGYGELPPGDYRFELRACLLGRCTEAKSMALTVTPGRWHEYSFVPWLAGLLGLLPFILIAYQWWRRREAEIARQRLEVDRLQLYRRLTQHKIGPHFANNALTAISNLIVRKENERALRYTGRFARLFRPVLEDGLPLLRPLREELDFIEDYLKLEKLRFSQKLSYRTEISAEVSQREEDILVPSLLIQSFVNNAVKHGIEPLEFGGELELIFRLADDDYLLVEITDNGPGYFVDGEPAGTGIRAANEILGYLDEHHRSNSRVDISLRDPLLVNSGTIVRLHLYLNYETLD